MHVKGNYNLNESTSVPRNGHWKDLGKRKSEKTIWIENGLSIQRSEKVAPSQCICSSTNTVIGLC